MSAVRTASSSSRSTAVDGEWRKLDDGRFHRFVFTKDGRRVLEDPGSHSFTTTTIPTTTYASSQPILRSPTIRPLSPARVVVSPARVSALPVVRQEFYRSESPRVRRTYVASPTRIRTISPAREISRSSYISPSRVVRTSSPYVSRSYISPSRVRPVLPDSAYYRRYTPLEVVETVRRPVTPLRRLSDPVYAREWIYPREEICRSSPYVSPYRRIITPTVSPLRRVVSYDIAAPKSGVLINRSATPITTTTVVSNPAPLIRDGEVLSERVFQQEFVAEEDLVRARSGEHVLDLSQSTPLGTWEDHGNGCLKRKEYFKYVEPEEKPRSFVPEGLWEKRADGRYYRNEYYPIEGGVIDRTGWETGVAVLGPSSGKTWRPISPRREVFSSTAIRPSTPVERVITASPPRRLVEGPTKVVTGARPLIAPSNVATASRTRKWVNGKWVY